MAGVVEIELLILALIYAGAGVAMVRAIFLRREAVAAWRRAAGGVFDHKTQHLANELEIDRARLPPEAARKLFESRRVLAAGFGALLLAIVLNFIVLGTV